MVLNFIRATGLKPTEQPSKVLDLASGIAVHSKAFKSIASEEQVAVDFCGRGFFLLAKRQKIKGCEVDLIFYDAQGGVVFVEVKAGSFERVIERWHWGRQRLRQQRVLQSFLERGFKLSWILSVAHEGQIQHLNLLD